MRYRLPLESDLATCRDLVHPGLRLSPACRQKLPEIWRDLLNGDALTAAIIEDPARPDAASIEAFGASVFVTDRFAEEFCAHPRPYLPALIYERMLAGTSPVLSAAEIRAANSAGGLNLVVLHFGMRDPDILNERVQRVLRCGSAAFYFGHAGFRLKLLLNEAYGPQPREFMLAGGFRLITDFATDEDLPGGLEPEHQPYLFMQRKEWTVPGAVNQLSFLFHSPGVQLGFASGEQRVLLRALLTASDAQIARDLGISRDAVKKTWDRIYERVARAAPYLLGVPERRGAHRGREKRRHLLDYLRSHLEELRPVATGSAGGTGTNGGPPGRSPSR